MRRIFQFTALVALLLWVPATVHCGLESMFGWTAQASCCDHEEGTTAPAEHCAVEDGAYRVGSTSIMIAAPDVGVEWCAVVCPAPASNPPAPPLARSESPPELARTWQFEERTALPVRAPSRVS